MSQMVGWRYVAGLLVSMGLLAAALVIGVMLWLTHRIDALHQEATHEVVALHVAKAEENLTRFVEDYAYWTLAHTIVETRDAEQVYEHLGSGADEGAAFDALFILDATGELAFAYAPQSGLVPETLWSPRLFAALIASLRQTEPAENISQISKIQLNGQVSLVSAAWITPDEISSFPDQPMPVLIGVRDLNEAWLQDLSASPYIQAARVDLTRPREAEAVFVLETASAQRMGYLSWETAYPGAALRRDILPGLLALCAGLLAMGISASRYFHRISRNLKRATQVASTDSLTGLKNRAGLDGILEEEAAQNAFAAGHVAVLYLDVNAFKPLNDTYGHQVGDIALKVLAERLQKAVRKGDIVVRLGGDEFACVIFDPKPEVAARRVADRLIAFMQDPIDFPEHTQAVQTAIGLAVAEPGTTWSTLLERADHAMYWAKANHCRDPMMFRPFMTEGPRAA